MDPIQPILVGLDFSTCSDRALAHADRLAHRWGREVRCVHAIDEHVLRDLASIYGLPYERMRRDAIRSAHDRIQQQTSPYRSARRGFPIVVAGHPREVLLNEVVRWEASLLVLGAHGVEGGPQPGSIAMSCVRHVPTDVLLVRGGDAAPFGRVLVCTGLGPDSDRVISRAADLVSPGGELELLHVMDPPWSKLRFRNSSPESAPKYRDQFERAVRGQLDGALALVREKHEGLELRATLLGGKRPSDAVLAHAAEHGPQLIVLGNRSQGFLDTLLLGRTASRILREARCSVMAVEPHRQPLLGYARSAYENTNAVP